MSIIRTEGSVRHNKWNRSVLWLCKSLHTHIFICLPLLYKPSLLSISLDCQFHYFPDITKFHKASKWETSQFMYYDDVHHQQVQPKTPMPGVQSTMQNITDSVIVTHPLMCTHRGLKGDFSSANFFWLVTGRLAELIMWWSWRVMQNQEWIYWNQCLLIPECCW